MNTIGFYLPFWLTDKLDSLGKNDPGRYPCLEHHELREPLARFIKTMVTRYRHSPALKYWNLWNEPTLNSTQNRIMLENFAAYLKDHYQNISQLRSAWRGEYPVFSFLCPRNFEELNAGWIAKAFRLGNRGRCTPMYFDWYRFLAITLDKQLEWINSQVKLHDPVHPTHTNLSSLTGNPCHGGRDPFTLAHIPDSISFSLHASNDYSPGIELCDRFSNFACICEQAYSWTRGQSHTMVGELQAGTTYCHHRQYTPSPTTMRNEFWRAVAADMKGLIHWLWQAWRGGTFELGDFGLRTPDSGEHTDRSREVADLASTYKQNHELLSGMKRPPAKIAILFSYDTFIHKMLLQHDHPNIHGCDNDANHALFGCFRALEAASLPCEFISEKQVEDGELERYQLLFLPGIEVMRAGVAEKIRSFVANGGNVYADGRVAYLDEHMYLRNRIPGHGLANLFGASEEDFTAEDGRVTLNTIDGQQVKGLKMRQRLRVVDGGIPSAYFTDGGIAAVDHSYGQGHTRIVGAQLCRALREYDDPDTLQYVADFARTHGISSPLTTPLHVIVRKLEGQNHDLFFVFNNSDVPQELRIPPDIRLIKTFYLQPDTTDILKLEPNAMNILAVQKN